MDKELKVVELPHIIGTRLGPDEDSPVHNYKSNIPETFKNSNKVERSRRLSGQVENKCNYVFSPI